MKRQDFLSKLAAEGNLELVESSEEVCAAYLNKTDDCTRSAKVLLENKLFENSVSSSYYAMYNSLTALLFKVGIKCKNHSGSILLLKKVFEKENLFREISWAKKERIDKQYYVTNEDDTALTQDSSKEMIEKAENFVISIRLLIEGMKNEDIEKARQKFNKIVKAKPGK